MSEASVARRVMGPVLLAGDRPTPSCQGRCISFTVALGYRLLVGREESDVRGESIYR